MVDTGKGIGCIDTTGKSIIDSAYGSNFLLGCNNKCLAVNVRQKFTHPDDYPRALFDFQGNQLTKFYEKSWSFGMLYREGVFGVQDSGRNGLVDYNGTEYWGK